MHHFELPELDRKKTKEAVEEALRTYRLYKYLTFDEREPTITARYEPMEGGRTNSAKAGRGIQKDNNSERTER